MNFPRLRRWLAICRSLVLSASTGAAGPSAAARAQDGCPVPPPVARVEAVPIYSDPAGSRLDVAALHNNAELIRPLRVFTDELTRLVDSNAGVPDEAARDCARTMLRDWAAAGALRRRPASFAAIRERQRFALGISLAALKLRAQDGTLDRPVVKWLHAVDSAVLKDFARRPVFDNLTVWSAANAASLALLDGDRGALDYADRVWREGLRQIDPDGFVPSELRRKSRALLYHQYYASGLLVLRWLRGMLGRSITAPEEADLRRLVDRVEASLCEPGAMAAAAGGYRQVSPSADQFAVGLVFGRGIIDERWTNCGTRPSELRDDTLGGLLGYTFALSAPRPR